MPFFYRVRGPEEYARPQVRASEIRLPKIFHPFRKSSRKVRRSPGPYREGAERMFLLFLPVYRVPSLLRLLSLWHRYLRDYDDGQGAPQPSGLQYQLGAGTGIELLPP